MSEKMPRILEDEGNSRSRGQGISYDYPTTPAFRSLVSEIMDLCAASSTIRPELERLLCRYMMQEGDFAFSERMLLSSKKWHSGHQINEAGPRSLQLCFLNKICQPVFTGVPIKGENFEPLMVALVDGESGEVVKTGPEASARVEIVALEADFGGCLGDSRTPEEFNTKIVTKEGNGGLLTGKVVLDLKEGKACVGIVRFPHTKIWKKQRQYRLGVVVTDDYIATKIRGGFSDTFFVKDRRLDQNRKHHPPILSDEVWRLVGIARDGAFHQRLSDQEVNINTVEDLLKKLNTDPQKLRDILGKNMTATMWKDLVDHARTCVVDETLYLFSSSEYLRKTSVLFNMVGQVMGLISGFQYFSLELLSESEKTHAIDLVVSAFQQWDKVVSFDHKASFDKYLGLNQIVYHLKSPTTEMSSSIEILIPSKNDELDLPQPAISFDDKASLFDESPDCSNIIAPPKSPMESSYPKIDAPDFPRPAVSFNDKGTLFDESPTQNNTIFPPKSPIDDNSGDPLILVSQKNNDLDFSPPAFCFDDDAILFDESPGLSNVICPPKSPVNKESCSGCKILISPEIDGLDFPQPVIPSQEIIPTCDSVWDMSYYNDYNWECVDQTCHKHERRLSYSSQVTDSDNWDMESLIQPCWEENHDIPLQFSVDDVPLDTQGLISESLVNPQNNGNEPLVTRPTVALMNNTRKRYLRNKAKRKWRVLFSVMRWLFVCRNTAGKLSVGGFPVKLSSSYQDSQALDSVDSWHEQPLTSGGDCVVPTSYETKSFQVFGSHSPVLSRNLSMKSEADLHSAVNDILFARSVAVATKIAQRKYLSKREKARRRWTKLYSVMRWFSVQRNVTKRASSALIGRDPSCSNSFDELSSIWATDSSRHDGYVRNWDMCPYQQNSTSVACPFYDDEFAQLFNAFCSLQPRNRIAMNKLARRRNAADRNFAKRRWRMLFSVMKWLSVRRNAARVKGPYNNY